MTTYIRAAAAACAVALLLAGCGGSSGSSKVDLGGFTTKDRALAQVALNTLKPTSIPSTIVQLTATIGLPAVCRVHFVGTNSGGKNLDVLVAWTPIRRSGDAFTWLTLTIGSSGAIPASLQLGVAPNAKVLRTHYGVAYTRPFEPCRINEYGWLTAVPLTFAGYPATGHALTVPNQGAAPVAKPCSLCVGGHKHG